MPIELSFEWGSSKYFKQEFGGTFKRLVLRPFHGLLDGRPQKLIVKVSESNILKMNSGPLGATVFGNPAIPQFLPSSWGARSPLRSGLCCEGEIRFGRPFASLTIHQRESRTAARGFPFLPCRLSCGVKCSRSPKRRAVPLR